ncbi:MAG: PAS domain S-box protein [Desulfatitalea sp.]|nr:PAS domain S-box protein [Desulfatitalea sp.]NNK01134.1 PAS domain S-box protein [Desulfatitalea sp.]
MTEDLKVKVQKLSEIISVSPVGIAIYDRFGQCISANDSLARIIGATKQQMLQQNYNRIESWKQSGLLDMAMKAVGSKSAMHHEVVSVSSFGKEVFLDCHIVPLGDTDLLFMAQDITDRKQADINFKASLQMADDIVRHIPFGILIYQFVAPDKLYLKSGNSEAEKMTGRKLADMVGMELKDSWEGAEEIGLAKSYLDVMLTGKNYETDEIFYKDKKLAAFFRVCAFPLPNDLLAITFENITEKKLAEKELHRAKAYSEKLIESANAMIVVLDNKGRVQRFNKAAEEITGYQCQELLGRNWFKILVPKDAYPDAWEAFTQPTHEKFPRVFENPIMTKAGRERFISWRNTALFEDGLFVGSISYGIDVTERKQLESQLLQTQKMEAIGQLTGGIAHDFNNMLSVILGHAELLKSSLPPGDPLLKSVLEIENAGLHSRDITRQLLAFSRKQIIAPKTTNLNKSIAIIKKTLTNLIGENIDLRFLLQKNLWTVRIDPSQVDQILFNLSANARDAMPDGGTLAIETSNIDIDEAFCALQAECLPGQYVLLSVTDDGVGMDKEMLLHVFEPFYTTKGLEKGTGLGLATVYGITRQNGGFITIHSDPGKGTTFNVYIPKLMDEVQEDTVEEKSPIEFHPATVLLVEDDDMVRRMTAEILKEIGYSVLIVDTPTEALALFEKNDTPIDLLITDVIMPQMSGTELVSKINKLKPEVKVLYMSGHTENIIVRQGILKEGIHFVQKPFSMSDLAKKVRETIEDQYDQRKLF